VVVIEYLCNKFGLGIYVCDASFETLQLIKSTKLNAAQTPYYLETLDPPMTERFSCDPQGSLKVTFDEYQMFLDHNFNYWLIPTDRIPGGIFIIGGQHIFVRICL